MNQSNGLKHSAITLTGVGIQLWLVYDGVREHGLDMRCVMHGLGMSWPRWRIYLLGAMVRLRVNHCLDREGKKTLVMPRENLARLLIELHNMQGNGVVSRNIARLLPEWQHYWASTQALQRADAVALSADKRSRKLAADKVDKIFELFQADMTIKAISAQEQVQLSESVVKKVIAGTYQSFDSTALAKWLVTFGKLKVDKRHIGLKPGTITAELIDRVFVLHQQKFKPAYIAQCLSISVTPVRQIIRGTYVSLDPLAEPKWASTFGAAHATEKPENEGIRLAASKSGPA